LNRKNENRKFSTIKFKDKFNKIKTGNFHEMKTGTGLAGKVGGFSSSKLSLPVSLGREVFITPNIVKVNFQTDNSTNSPKYLSLGIVKNNYLEDFKKRTKYDSLDYGKMNISLYNPPKSNISLYVGKPIANFAYSQKDFLSQVSYNPNLPNIKFDKYGTTNTMDELKNIRYGLVSNTINPSYYSYRQKSKGYEKNKRRYAA
jgi:hypothetical protein